MLNSYDFVYCIQGGFYEMKNVDIIFVNDKSVLEE